MMAEDFKILFVNTDNIKIGKNTCVAGDVFSDAGKIYWKNSKQAMKVISLDTKTQYVMVSEDFKNRKLKSAKDFMVKYHRLSTRGIGSLSSVSSVIGNKLYWLNPTLIKIDYVPEEGDYFFLLTPDNEIIRLEVEDQQLVIDDRIWGEANPFPIETDLYFHYKDGEDKLVKSGILISPLPTEIRLKKR
ncbi:MAG: hypothetical protein J5801_02610 [Bacteroidales bacterium]|nr:hypothetical protein [Bacteroidales bacterium]